MFKKLAVILVVIYSQLKCAVILHICEYKVMRYTCSCHYKASFNQTARSRIMIYYFFSPRLACVVEVFPPNPTRCTVRLLKHVYLLFGKHV